MGGSLFVNNKYVETVEVVYDMGSANSNVNWGYTSGINGGSNITGKNFAKYKYLKIYAKDFWGTVGICIIDFSKLGYSDFCGMALVGNKYYNSNNGHYTEDMFFFRVTINAQKTTLGLLVEQRTFTEQPTVSGNIITNTDNVIYKIEGII